MGRNYIHMHFIEQNQIWVISSGYLTTMNVILTSLYAHSSVNTNRVFIGLEHSDRHSIGLRLSSNMALTELHNVLVMC